MEIRSLRVADNPVIKHILQVDLEAAGLAIPGTAYDDQNLETLAQFYAARAYRHYFVLVHDHRILGGAGVAEYDLARGVAELQKFYLAPNAQGHGLSYQLLDRVIATARQLGYHQLYLESHHRLTVALHVYQRRGFRFLSAPLRPTDHSAMDRFMLKTL